MLHLRTKLDLPPLSPRPKRSERYRMELSSYLRIMKSFLKSLEEYLPFIIILYHKAVCKLVSKRSFLYTYDHFEVFMSQWPLK